ncbi:response regulator [Altererythrobacter aurantiacus]|uniref:DNA-binding transcriptional regulator NtrC n=1 Tax=Parapontixanthobacter aurantiacus TaxID=1463599 RepID=A0A844ZEA0_9SPHN|nr:sigma-54 dependent transcriptional regulator [Parapontixanthobacter aurantiacus]MXO85337.1 response regulator [Parapontixanthobacter aurantiacus]
MKQKILLVEDDDGIAAVIEAGLNEAGFEADHCLSVAERDRLLDNGNYDAIITDIMLQDGDGIADLEQVRERAGDIPVIIVSAQNTFDTAIRATDAKAFEYFPKPFDLDELVRAAVQATRRNRNQTVREVEGEDALPLIGTSQAMQQVFRMITRVMRNDLSVLVTGESGTGKELVAEAIHQLGSRRSGPFVAVNCAAIPHDLIESELFGHEKGAFTGAISQAIGKFEQANGGTLFLDEIGDMPSDAQTRLLRALQSGRIRRVGGRQDVSVDARIIAATNRDLAPLIARGSFREDLFYRLNVIPIHLPPLRERREDIAALTHHFFKQAEREGLPNRTISPEAIERLATREWRGNVRELRNVVFRLAVFAREDVITNESLSDLELWTETNEAAEVEAGFDRILSRWIEEEKPAAGSVYHKAISEFERPLFTYALKMTNGNQIKASQYLGINRNTLRKKLADLKLSADNFAGQK